MATPLGFGVAVLAAPSVTQASGQGREIKIEVTLPENVREVMLQVFGNPVQTLFELTTTGYVASIPGLPVRLAQLGPGRISAVTPVVEDTARAVTTLSKLLFSQNKNLRVGAYGLNYEYEDDCPSDGEPDAGRWIAGRFYESTLNLSGGWSPAKGEVVCTLNHADGAQRNITIQPRVGKPSMIFVKVNNHFSVPGTLNPCDEKNWVSELNREFSRSVKFVDEILKKPKKRGRKP